MEQRKKFILFAILDIFLVCLAAAVALFIHALPDCSELLGCESLRSVSIVTPFIALISIAIFYKFGLYTSMWEYAGEKELVHIIEASTLVAALEALTLLVLQMEVPGSFLVDYFMILIAFVASSRYILRRLRKRRLHGKAAGQQKRTMLIGGGVGATMVLREFTQSKDSKNNVLCIIDDDEKKWGQEISGIKIVGGREYILAAAKKYKIEEIVFCIPSATAEQKKGIWEICRLTKLPIKTMPGIYQIANGEVEISKMRDINIEDLLGRDVITTESALMAERVRGRVVMVTGGGGSIGSELCRQLAAFEPARLVIFDIYENNAYDIQQELKHKYPKLQLSVIIGSVRDRAKLDEVIAEYQPAIICHAAAHKHVPLMEDSPSEAIKNNVFGTYNAAKAAAAGNVPLFILISTDKAVNPTNVMGASKRMCEMIVQSMNNYAENTRYIAVRFGNVLGSNGSVVQLFKRQIAEGGPVTVTDKRVTRFFMTIPEAVSLVLTAGSYAKGGEVFVLDMGQPVLIDDMARNMIRLSGHEPDKDIQIVYTGLRPGEKLYEELLLNSEGLQKTDSDLIFIGHQEYFTAEEIHEKLDRLEAVLHEEPKVIRDTLMDVISRE